MNFATQNTENTLNMEADFPINLEKKLTKINSLSQELSSISSSDSNEVDDEFAATKFWKDYHDYHTKLSTIKKEIDEFKNLNNEYTGAEDFKFDMYHRYQGELKKAVRDTNDSYRRFSGIDYEYIK